MTRRGPSCWKYVHNNGPSQILYTYDVYQQQNHDDHHIYIHSWRESRFLEQNGENLKKTGRRSRVMVNWTPYHFQVSSWEFQDLTFSTLYTPPLAPLACILLLLLCLSCSGDGASRLIIQILYPVHQTFTLLLRFLLSLLLLWFLRLPHLLFLFPPRPIYYFLFLDIFLSLSLFLIFPVSFHLVCCWKWLICPQDATSTDSNAVEPKKRGKPWKWWKSFCLML